MKNLLIVFLIVGSCLTVFGQTAPASQIETDETSEQFIKWLARLYEHGVVIQEDSIIISSEIQNVINNKELRDFLYPETYTWEGAVALLERMEIKRALWYFINLYPGNKEMVMTAILKYDHLFEMDHALMGAFNTYVLVDPQISVIVDGKPEIKRPDLLERKLEIVREIIEQLLYYRSNADKECP